MPLLRHGLDTGSTAQMASHLDGHATSRGAVLAEEAGVASSATLDTALASMRELTPGQAAERDRLLGRRTEPRTEPRRTEPRGDFEARFARAFPPQAPPLDGGGGGERRQWQDVAEPPDMHDDETQGGWTARE